MMTFADVCRDARDYCNSHFQYEKGYEDVYKARQEDESVNKAWQEMFDAYVANWED